MKPYTVSLFNAATLIIFGLWGYFVSDNPSLTAFIPVIAGSLILICIPGLKKENKTIAHIAVILTLLIFAGLIKPLVGAISRDDAWAIARILIMMFSSFLAMFFFVKSFINARRRRK